MKKFKSLFITLALFGISVVFFSACNKDDNNGNGGYFFRFKANEIQYNYDFQLLLTAQFTQSGDQHLGTITGANDASSNIGLQLYDDNSFKTGIYSGFTIDEGVTKGVIIGHLDPITGLIFGSGGGQNVDATIVITEFTDASVRGTFEGSLLRTGYPDIIIEEGEFFVKRVN